jgi:telomerase Cajal body protein 1
LHAYRRLALIDVTLGIVSSLAINPDYSGTYAAGTYSSSPHAIGLFDSDVGPNPTLFLGHVRRGGVTQIMFHPTRQYIIYAASRRSSYIQIWDLRNPHELTGEFLRGTESSGTNQRLRFDIDLGGKWLATGEEVHARCNLRLGLLIRDAYSGAMSFRKGQYRYSMYPVQPRNSTRSQSCNIRHTMVSPSFWTIPTTLTSTLITDHADSIGSVAFHPIDSIALTVSGSRHFERDSPEHDLDESSDISDATSNRQLRVGYGGTVRDASMKIWDFSEGPRVV